MIGQSESAHLWLQSREFLHYGTQSWRYSSSQIDIYHMADVAENNLAQCTYTEENSNWTFDKYATLHKKHHNTLVILK